MREQRLRKKSEVFEKVSGFGAEKFSWLDGA